MLNVFFMNRYIYRSIGLTFINASICRNKAKPISFFWGINIFKLSIICFISMIIRSLFDFTFFEYSRDHCFTNLILYSDFSHTYMILCILFTDILYLFYWKTNFSHCKHLSYWFKINPISILVLMIAQFYTINQELDLICNRLRTS